MAYATPAQKPRGAASRICCTAYYGWSRIVSRESKTRPDEVGTGNLKEKGVRRQDVAGSPSHGWLSHDPRFLDPRLKALRKAGALIAFEFGNPVVKGHEAASCFDARNRVRVLGCVRRSGCEVGVAGYAAGEAVSMPPPFEPP